MLHACSIAGFVPKGEGACRRLRSKEPAGGLRLETAAAGEPFVLEEASPAASFSRIGRSWSCRWGSGNVWRQRMQRHGTYPRSPSIAAVRRVCRGLRRSRRSTEYVSCVRLGRRHARRGAFHPPPPAYGGVGCLRSAQLLNMRPRFWFSRPAVSQHLAANCDLFTDA